MEKEMSELMDLEKAAMCWCDPRTKNIVMIPELATVFAEALASERQRMIEKFRPVVEKIEHLKQHQMRVASVGFEKLSATIKLAEDALALWKEIEKET